MSEQSVYRPAVETIENARLKDGRPGDHLVWEHTRRLGGVITVARREGIAHHRDRDGDWRTEDGQWITYGVGEDRTLTIHRVVANEEENR